MGKLKTDYDSLKTNKEMRFQEVRANEITNDDGSTKMIIEGYACVFNQRTLIGNEEWGFYEIVERNAFDNADFKDCCLKYNHGDTKGILARVKNGSLKCSVDDKGLFIRAELIDTTDNVDIYKCIRAGLLDKMSFAFTVSEHSIDRDTKPFTRKIIKIKKVWDCAVVDVPAYDGTSIYARSKELVEAELKSAMSLENDNEALENALEVERMKARIKGGLF